MFRILNGLDQGDLLQFVVGFDFSRNIPRVSEEVDDKAESLKAYEDFFAPSKDADPEIPILLEAKKEYERLQTG